MLLPSLPVGTLTWSKQESLRHLGCALLTINFNRFPTLQSRLLVLLHTTHTLKKMASVVR
jgi:hypothetical protein